MMIIENKYRIGEFVFLITDPENLKRVVTGIEITAGGNLLYRVACGGIEGWHYEFEICKEEAIKR